jgi:two-component system, chemotaxis family, CheB/CheR fusion protein
MATGTDPRAALLEHIRSQRGIDFSAYKEGTLQRRLRKRLQATGSPDYDAYLSHLRSSPAEFVPLLNTLFIGVTQFFRDPPAWAVLRQHLARRIARAGSDRLRVWCAGVASGEEAYSVAILLAELMGQDTLPRGVTIHATDVAEPELMRARIGAYSGEELTGLPTELRDRYLEPVEGGLAIREDLRRRVVFHRHDLLVDEPIPELDLLVCRNTLMYFNRDAQDRVLDGFHAVLGAHGLLFLGKAEMLLSRRHLFEPVDPEARLFRQGAGPARATMATEYGAGQDV